MVMKSVSLIYFSPTGTTKKILEAIAEGLGADMTEHIDLTKTETRTARSKNISGCLTVIGVPVYTGRVALEAIKGLEQFKATDTPAVIVVVYGNREYEDALLELKNITTGLGFTPIAGGTFIGEHSFSTEDTPIARGRPDTQDLDRARLFGAMVQNKMLDIDSFRSMLTLEVPGNFPYRERGPVRNTSPETSDALCVRCGRCVEVCPVATVTLNDDGVTTDKSRCILCCSCVKNCTAGARRLVDPQLTQLIQRLGILCRNRKEPEFFF